MWTSLTSLSLPYTHNSQRWMKEQDSSCELRQSCLTLLISAAEPRMRTRILTTVFELRVNDWWTVSLNAQMPSIIAGTRDTKRLASWNPQPSQQSEDRWAFERQRQRAVGMLCNKAWFRGLRVYLKGRGKQCDSLNKEVVALGEKNIPGREKAMCQCLG